MRLLDKLSAKALTVQLSGEPTQDADGWWYPTSSWPVGKEIDGSFESHVSHAYKKNGIVFACITARQMPFSEARFLYQEVRDGNPGKLVSGPGLGLLDRPWSNGRTGDLLSRMEQDASLSGNFYCTPIGGARPRLRRLRPDWVISISGVRGDEDASPYDLDAELLTYIYHPPGGRPVLLTPDKVVHYAPIPDPDAQWRGMSWLTPVLNEITADTQMTQHKIRFLRRGTTLNFAIAYDKSIPAETVKTYAAMFREQHEGAENAYKTLHIGGGADPKPLSVNLKDLDYKAIQGAGETRIAAAAGVGAIMANLSEGLAGAAMNSGNYEVAKRKFADTTLRPNWRTASGALEHITTPPEGDRLWYDTRDVEFLKADRKEAAEIQSQKATTVNTLMTAGFTPDSARAAVEADDFSLLEHTGLYSVQLQSPGGSDPTAPLPPAEIAELLQKIYLAAANGVISNDEAREIANRAGAGLTGPAPAPAAPAD